MIATSDMLHLVVTAWFSGHLIGVLSLGTYGSTSSKCFKEGIAIVEVLKKKKQNRRIKFNADCILTNLANA